MKKRPKWGVEKERESREEQRKKGANVRRGDARVFFWGLKERVDFRDAFIVVFRAIFRWCKQDGIYLRRR